MQSEMSMTEYMERKALDILKHTGRDPMGSRTIRSNIVYSTPKHTPPTVGDNEIDYSFRDEYFHHYGSR